MMDFGFNDSDYYTIGIPDEFLSRAQLLKKRELICLHSIMCRIGQDVVSDQTHARRSDLYTELRRVQTEVQELARTLLK